jgi:hypothetical protein
MKVARSFGQSAGNSPGSFMFAGAGLEPQVKISDTVSLDEASIKILELTTF